MPNHKHVVFKPLEESKGKYYPLSKIMHSLKRRTAYEANLFLERNGAFWQHENYDHFARGEAELERIINSPYAFSHRVSMNEVHPEG